MIRPSSLSCFFSSSGAALASVLALGTAGCSAADGDAVSQLAQGQETAPLPAAVRGALDALPASPLGAVVRRVAQDGLRGDGRLDAREAHALAAFVKDARGLEPHVAALLSALVSAEGLLTDDGLAEVRRALTGKSAADVGLTTAVYRVEPGRSASLVSDDEIYLTGDGTVAGGTGLVGHSRGYAKLADGVLRKSHGSPAPFFASVHTPETVAALRSQGPHRALDAMAVAAGLDLGAFGFVHLAEKGHYDPRAPYWAGLCHAWTYTSLDDRLNVLVDVNGVRGEQGLWLAGQWLSRADLGNWLMGVANHLSVADAALVDSFVTPEDWLKGVTQWVLTSGRGLRADLWNDAERGRSEIWNQPVYDATVTVETLPEAAREAVIAYARGDRSFWVPPPADATARLVRIHARWGAEVRDNHEGPVSLGESDWAFYALTAADGRVLKGYMPQALRAAGVDPLPSLTSDALPDYFAYPKHELVDAALAGRADWLLDGAQEGKYFRFYVATVLARGIPQATRAAFEAEALGSDAPSAEVLKARYPGVGAAYSRDEWARAFAPRLGDGAAFGVL